MRAAVHAAARRAAGIDQHQRGAGGQPLEAALQRHRRRRLARAGARQHQIHQGALAFPAAVEQRQPAVAMAEEAHHRRHAVDRGDQLGRRAALGRAQRRTHVDQMAQHRDLQVRRALGDHAVMRDIALHELGEPREILLEALLEALAVAQEGYIGEDHRLQHQHRLVADQPGARDAAQMGALAAERRARSAPGSRDRPQRPASRSGGSSGRCARPAPRASSSSGDQRHSRSIQSSTRCTASDGRRGIAAVAQVAQPGEAVQGIEPQRADAARAATADRRSAAPRRRPGRGPSARRPTSRRPTTESPGQGSGATAKKLLGLRWPRVRE